MLTEAEIEWLERRGNACTRCGIKECCIRKGNNRVKKCDFFEIKSIGSKSGMLDENFSDAAEFEARVAEKLARDICFRCPDKYNEICPKGIGYFRLKLDIVSCGMKHARLAVEEEMESSK